MAAKIYATLRKRYCTEALKSMGFTRDGSMLVKRHACRKADALRAAINY